MASTHLLTIDFELTGYENGSLAQPFFDNTNKLLSRLEENQVSATFFCVGEVLEKFPFLVKSIAEQGHEIACHGWRHIPLDKTSPKQLRKDLDSFLNKAEELQLGKIYGYRAPFFSLTKETDWAKDIILGCGFRYDSSILPATALLYGDSTCPHAPHTLSNGLLEIPITVWQPLSLIGLKFGIPLFGGTYLRLSPYSLIEFMLNHFRKKKRPLISYCHPYDMDTSLNNIKAFENNRLFNYLLNQGQHTVWAKVNTLIKDSNVQTIQSWLEKNREDLQ